MTRGGLTIDTKRVKDEVRKQWTRGQLPKREPRFRLGLLQYNTIQTENYLKNDLLMLTRKRGKVRRLAWTGVFRCRKSRKAGQAYHVGGCSVTVWMQPTGGRKALAAAATRVQHGSEGNSKTRRVYRQVVFAGLTFAKRKETYGILWSRSYVSNIASRSCRDITFGHTLSGD